MALVTGGAGSGPTSALPDQQTRRFIDPEPGVRYCLDTGPASARRLAEATP